MGTYDFDRDRDRDDLDPPFESESLSLDDDDDDDAERLRLLSELIRVWERNRRIVDTNRRRFGSSFAGDAARRPSRAFCRSSHSALRWINDESQ